MTVYGTEQASALSLLSFVLKREYGAAALPGICRTAAGKPYFQDLPGLHFNWSHSGPYLICAFSSHPVGADIEVVRPRRAALPEYAFTEREQALYRSLGGDWSAFYTLWTRKEAWCKYTGDGLAKHWRETPGEDGLFYGFYAGENWRAAVCGEEPAPDSILWIGRDDLP